MNHKDGIKTNNIYTNLEWVTYSENNKHAYKMKLKDENGIKNPSNIYNEEIIHKICKLIENNPNLSTKIISEKVFGCYNSKYKSLINHIKNKDRWITISKNYNF